tara:strand:+ start:1751 stop:1930 length:180 start_codon:yes stop_codon:yes gene_type:complete
MKKNLSKKINTGNWRTCANKGFMYTGLNDPDYIKDKKEFLAKNGNGWWYTQGVQRREGY